MPTKVCYLRTLCVSLLLSAGIWGLLCAFGKGTSALTLGFLAGMCMCALALWLYFAAWRAAPDKGRVALFYVLRFTAVFGSVLVAMFLPWVDAVGVLIPHLFPTPVLAVMLLFTKKDTPEQNSAGHMH